MAFRKWQKIVVVADRARKCRRNVVVELAVAVGTILSRISRNASNTNRANDEQHGRVPAKSKKSNVNGICAGADNKVPFSLEFFGTIPTK